MSGAANRGPCSPGGVLRGRNPGQHVDVYAALSFGSRSKSEPGKYRGASAKRTQVPLSGGCKHHFAIVIIELAFCSVGVVDQKTWVDFLTEILRSWTGPNRAVGRLTSLGATTPD